MNDIFETPREVRLYRKQLGLTLAQRNIASAMWKQGSGTDQIAIALGLAEEEYRVYNSLQAIKGKP